MTLVEYDQTYQQQDFFGDPYVGLFEFFEQLPHKGTLCDLGAGQGRDCVPLAKLGFDVTAVDISSIGLAQIAAKDPSIHCVKDDFFTFPVGTFDIVFMDSILHFYKAHREAEIALVQRICHALKPGAIFANCTNKSVTAERQLRKAVADSQVNFRVLKSCYLEYPKRNRKYHFLAIQKISDKSANT